MNSKQLIRNLGYALLCIGIGLALIAFGLTMWYAARKVNYNFSYKSMVQETVREMVKEEALKNER